MKKVLILFMGICLTIIYSETPTNNLDITNQCSGLKLLEVKLYPRKNYRKEDIYGFQYGLKNTTDKDLSKIKLTLYLKNKEGHRVGESSFSEKELKAHYELPLKKNSYYAIDNLPSDFLGVADLEITCNNTPKEKTKNLSELTDIRIPTKLYEKIKESTENKTDIETRIQILLILANSLK